MKKYLSIIKMTILERFKYFGDIIGSFFVYGLIIFMFMQLWNYIYGSSNNIIAGYSINQMIWYVIITEMIWFTCRTKPLKREISNDIKSGRIAYLINKPYNYVLYILAKSMGELIPNLLSFLFISIIVGFGIIGPLETFNLISIPFVVITLCISILITSLIYILIGLIAFWVEENSPFIWIYEKMILILGITFPIEIFPQWLSSFVKVSPIYATVYAPAKMLVDYSFSSFSQIILIQIIYLILLILLVTYVFRKGVKKVNVNGG